MKSSAVIGTIMAAMQADQGRRVLMARGQFNYSEICKARKRSQKVRGLRKRGQ